MIDPMREAFEKEHSKLFPFHKIYTKNDDGSYVDVHCQLAYKLWQAALSQPRMGEDEAVEEIGNKCFGKLAMSSNIRPYLLTKARAAFDAINGGGNARA